MVDFVLAGFAVIGLGIAVITFMLNAYTPTQPGPLPFLFGAGLVGICLFALLAKHLVWR